MLPRATLALFVAVIVCAVDATAQPARQGGPPPVPSVSRRPAGWELITIRGAAENEAIWFGWRVAVPTNSFPTLTFSEAAARADAMGFPNVEVSSGQIVAAAVPKRFDYRLQSGERNAVTYRLRELRLQTSIYRVDDLPADDAVRRRIFELARGLPGRPTIVVPAAGAAAAADLDRLASEYETNVAIESTNDPHALVATLRGRTERVGVAADLDAWRRGGIAPVEGLRIAGDRLMAVSVSRADAPGISAFFLAAYHARLRSLLITIRPAGRSEADLLRSVQAFEQAMLPAMAERVRVMLGTPAGQIRGGDRLSADMRAQIEAATPRRAVVTPRRPRRMLVTDVQMYTGHATVPHGNYLLELLSKHTGAFDVVFSNDPQLLRYPQLQGFDAVFFSNTCGMVHNDPDVRADLLRFVREGGGIAGTHAVTYTNNHWPEFAELMGGWAGPHRVEKQVLKVDDPDSPLTRSFPATFEHTDEYYQFPINSPYSRHTQRVLLSIDVEKSDRATGGRFCEACPRPDQDYGFAWIKEYGKGRAYFTALGHTESFYTDPRFASHLLAAIQYVLGDLEVDATPSAKLRDK